MTSGEVVFKNVEEIICFVNQAENVLGRGCLPGELCGRRKVFAGGHELRHGKAAESSDPRLNRCKMIPMGEDEERKRY